MRVSTVAALERRHVGTSERQDVGTSERQDVGTSGRQDVGMLKGKALERWHVGGWNVRRRQR